MSTDLTKKEKDFVTEYLDNGHNGTQAALAVYNTEDPNTAGVIAHENLSKPKIKDAIKEALPDDLLAQKHKELFNQKQLAYFTFSKEMPDEEIIDHVEAAGFAVIVVRPSDKVKYAFYSIDDAQAKSKALDMAYKVRGTYAPEKSVSLNFTADAQQADPELDKLREEFNSKIKEKIINDIRNGS